MWRLKPDAWIEVARDQFVGLRSDPGPELAIDVGLAWLKIAQDRSSSNDGGISRHFSLLSGWAASYPETTGYAIPTLIEQGKGKSNSSLLNRARRALDWLVSIQFENGAFQGGTIGTLLLEPVTFDTGQILIGMAAGTAEFGNDYRGAMGRAAQWLVDTQSNDGAWRTLNPHLGTHADTARTFETHVAWGLFEAARLEPNKGWGEAGLANIRWAITHQRPNGWFDHCCLSDCIRPLTHTLAYAIRGVIEAYRFSGEKQFLESALLSARAMANVTEENGFLAGRFTSDWKPAVNWSCLTGSAQMAACWFMLYQETRDLRLLKAGLAANRFVRRTLCIDGEQERLGGVKGAFPVWGKYGRFEFLNWACKFMIDANSMELSLKKGDQCNPDSN
jgi:hypothetical protein